MGDAQMGLQARLMSQAMRKLTAIIGKSRTVLIFINQIRMKIGLMFGNPETTTGGNALKFYSSLRLEVRRTETIEGGKDADAVGNRVKVKVVKNKVAPPFRKAELEVIFGKGVSASASLLDAAVKYGLIDKKGAWYSYGEEKVGQGRDSARDYLEQNPAFAKQLEEQLRKIIFPGREFSRPGEKPAPSGPGERPPVPVSGSTPRSDTVSVPLPDLPPGAGEFAEAAPAVSAQPGLRPAASQPSAQPAPGPQPTATQTAAAQPTAAQMVPRPAASQPEPRPAAPQPGPGSAEAPRRGPGRPPASQQAPGLPAGPRSVAPPPGPGSAEAPRRGPGRPPASPPASQPASSPPDPAEGARRGPGRPRKAENEGDVLF
jgi:recombination protein RecA